MTLDTQAVQRMAQAYADAWSRHDPAAVAAFYAPDGVIAINDGDPIEGTAAVTEMVSGFYAEFPDLVVLLDECRTAGANAIFAWTLAGRHAGAGAFVRVRGWEAWRLNDDLKIAESRGYFDAEDYQRQIDAGA